MRSPHGCDSSSMRLLRKPRGRVAALLVCHLREAESGKTGRGKDCFEIGRLVMKVVLLAGGLGTRLREETEFRPKPMVEIGGRPNPWHKKKKYAAAGYSDFVIWLGVKGGLILGHFFDYQGRYRAFHSTTGDGRR